MKYAVISDIHGNAPAFEAVLKDAKENGAQAYILAGDYYLSMPFPSEVAAIMKGLPGALIVCGNEEGNLKSCDPIGKTDGQMQAMYWACDRLSSEDKEYFSSLPKYIDEEIEGVGIHISHSSEEFISDSEHKEYGSRKVSLKYPEGPISREHFQKELREYFLQDREFLGRVDEIEEGIYIFGHSHSQWSLEVEGKLFLNPGSCGLPLDIGNPGEAPYTLLEIKDGGWSVEERRVAYDLDKLTEAMDSSGFSKKAFVWSDIVKMELREGREIVYYFLTFTKEYAEKKGDPIRPYTVETWEEAYRAWCSTKGIECRL